jgi:hypothetical protein
MTPSILRTNTLWRVGDDVNFGGVVLRIIGRADEEEAGVAFAYAFYVEVINESALLARVRESDRARCN